MIQLELLITHANYIIIIPFRSPLHKQLPPTNNTKYFCNNNNITKKNIFND